MLQLIRIQPSWICCHLHFSERPNKIKCDPIAANTRFWFFFPPDTTKEIWVITQGSKQVSTPSAVVRTETVRPHWARRALPLHISVFVSQLIKFCKQKQLRSCQQIIAFYYQGSFQSINVPTERTDWGWSVSGQWQGGFLCISSSELQDGVFICHDSWGCVDTKHTVNAASIPFNKLPRKKYEKNDSSWGHIDGYKILEALCSSHRLMDQYYCSYQKPSEPITPGRGAGARGGGGGAVTANYCQCFIYGRIHLISQQ